MIERKIEAYLSETFNLPIVKDITQTKVSKVISYRINKVSVHTHLDDNQKFILEISIYLRSINGYDCIGYLSHKINSAKVQSSDLNLTVRTDGNKEHIEFESITEIIISKNIIIMMTANYDQVREKIKKIEMENIIK